MTNNGREAEDVSFTEPRVRTVVGRTARRRVERGSMRDATLGSDDADGDAGSGR
jgi:hypothetical protein